MSASFNLEEMKPWISKLEGFSWLKPRIKAKNLAYIGLRDVDDHERKAIEMAGILAFSSKEVSSLGIDKVLEIAFESICPGGKRPLHVSFDIDALDDLEVKSTGTPVPGGLTLREGLTIVEKVRQVGNLVSMDLVEINPLIGSEADVKRTAVIAKQLILNTFGYYRGGVSTKPFPKP
jgi:arginase